VVGVQLWYTPKLLQSIMVEFTPYHSRLSPHTHSWNSSNRPHFSIFIHEYMIFPPYLPFYTLSLYLPPSHWCQPPDRTCFTFLFSVLKKHAFVCLYLLYKEFHCGISMYVCVITRIGSSPPFFSFLP
jgi:hypothetical protein